MDAVSQFLNWRTTAEARGKFEADFGYDDGNGGSDEGAPSADEMPSILERLKRGSG